MPVLLANHMPAPAIAIVGAVFVGLVLALLHIEQRISKQVKPHEHVAPPS